VIVNGTQKRLTQWWKNVKAQAAVVVEAMGTASGHLLDLSIIVNKCVYPLDMGSGPTKSMLT
jgi:hypothetical protein